MREMRSFDPEFEPFGTANVLAGIRMRRTADRKCGGPRYKIGGTKPECI